MSCECSLRNVLRARTACTFSTSIPPKVPRTPHVFHILAWKCTSRHSCVMLRAIFPHPNFQKVVKAWCVLMCFVHLTWKCASACNFSFLLWPGGSAPAALASLLFDPPDPQIIRKTKRSATFLTFRASVSSFFWLFPFPFLSSTLLFYSPYCRKFDS